MKDQLFDFWMMPGNVLEKMASGNQGLLLLETGRGRHSGILGLPFKGVPFKGIGISPFKVWWTLSV